MIIESFDLKPNIICRKHIINRLPQLISFKQNKRMNFLSTSLSQNLFSKPQRRCIWCCWNLSAWPNIWKVHQTKHLIGKPIAWQRTICTLYTLKVNIEVKAHAMIVLILMVAVMKAYLNYSTQFCNDRSLQNIVIGN